VTAKTQQRSVEAACASWRPWVDKQCAKRARQGHLSCEMPQVPRGVAEILAKELESAGLKAEVVVGIYGYYGLTVSWGAK